MQISSSHTGLFILITIIIYIPRHIPQLTLLVFCDFIDIIGLKYWIDSEKGLRPTIRTLSLSLPLPLNIDSLTYIILLSI